MELIRPGILLKSSGSLNLIHDINSNNVISLKLKKQFLKLNKVTLDLLSTDLAKYSEESEKEAKDDNVSILQDAFQELYYLLDIDQFKLTKISKINISKFQEIDNKIKGIELDNAIGHQLKEIIIEYMNLVINLKLSNTLVYNTLVLKNRLAYWERINDSTFNKIIYFVQISPIKIVELFKSIGESALDSIKKEQVTFASFSLVDSNELLYKNAQIAKENFILYCTFIKRSIYSFAHHNSNITLIKFSNNKLFKSLKFIWTSPMRISGHEISKKMSKLNDEIDANAIKIDRLINGDANMANLENLMEISLNESDNEKVSKLLNKLSELEVGKLNPSIDIPSFLTRYWPLLFVLIKYGPSSSVNIYKNRYEIWKWIQHNLVDTVVGFYKNWLIKPIKGMLGTLRQDDELTITSKESLKSDLDSLERMVVDLMVDQKSNIDRDEIHNLIQKGNLTMLMSKYEKEIRSPLKSLVNGNLIRSLLIQIQKTKVDGAIAINGIDKLLKSQQLVFGLVSVSPSILIVYKLWDYLTSSKPLIIDGKDIKVICLKSLNTIENLIINRDSLQAADGKIMVEIMNLLLTSKLIIPKLLRNDWIKDLNELNNNKYDNATKLRLVNKIWNVYGVYMR